MFQVMGLVAVLVTSAPASAADVAVFPPAIVDATPAQAENVASRVTRAYARLSGLQVLAPADLGEVSADHVEAAKARSERVFVVKSGLVVPLGVGSNAELMLVVGVDARFESPTHFVQLGGGFLVPRHALGGSFSSGGPGYGGVYAELGGGVYLRDTLVAPYLGFGVQPRLLSGGNTLGAVLAAYGEFGVMRRQVSSVRLHVGLRVAQSLTPLERINNDDSTSSSHPTEVGVEVGIGW
jgi:hypothetical protein